MNYRNPYAPTRRQQRRDWVPWIVGGVLAACFVLVIGVVVGAYKMTERHVCTVIESTERTEDTMYVYTEAGTFKMADSLGILAPQRFSTSDEFGRLAEGPACFDAYGWRIPILSNYPNIFNVEQD